VAAAQQHNIATDRSFGSPSTLTGPNYTIPAILGRQIGGNLFHSFDKFSLQSSPVQESATFTSTGSTGMIKNVIGRVTGGVQSDINGAVISNISGANLYLINPSGIVFGPNATVSVLGSFHASTADYLKMSDGTKIPTGNPDSSTFSAASPVAFGFLTATPAKIAVNGSTLGPVPAPPVSAPASLGLVAGPVSITGGALRAPAGTIQVTGVAGTGEVPVNPGETSAFTVTSFAPVDIKSSGPTRSLLTATNGGSVFIRSSGLTIDASTIAANNNGSGPGGQIVLRGDNQVTLSSGTSVQAFTSGSGSGAGVTISTAPAGMVRVDASTVSSLTSSTASNAGPGGAISIVAGQLALYKGANVLAGSCAATAAADCGNGSGPAAGAGGGVAVMVGSLTIESGASLGTVARGTGNAGNVSVMVGGPVTVDMSVGAGPSVLDGIGSMTLATTRNAGNAGDVSVTAGALTITNNGLVLSLSQGAGNSGSVSVNVSGMLSVDGSRRELPQGTGIVGDSVGSTGSTGNAGTVSVSAGSLSIVNTGVISSSTFGRGNAGSVSVNVAGGLTIDGAMTPGFSTGIASNANTGSTGNAGPISVSAGAISVVNAGQISSSTSGSRNAGQITVAAETLSIASNGQIISGTVGSGDGGSISVTVAGQLSLDGARGNPILLTGISSQSQGSGAAGAVTVTAGALSIVRNAAISSNTFGSGKGGSVSVMVDGQLTVDATGAAQSLTGIAANSEFGSTGNAGDVTVTAGTLSLVNGGAISSSAIRPDNNLPASTGNAGSVTVNVAGLLSLSGQRARIATETEAGTTGNAGLVAVTAPQITITTGAEIASTTAGTGAGGSVSVTTPGALVLDGAGVADTQIAASAIGPQSGPGGAVTVSANSLTVKGGAEIASSTAGPGKGGDVNITVASDIVLPDPGPQITARSTGGGDAGSITLSAVRLRMNNGAAISTEAVGERSAASGGNITLHVRDLLYLVSSEISTSVKGETGDGGNITIDPQLVILNHSRIKAEAIKGHGGNITITAGEFIPSSDSIISATSELGISGTVVINGPRVDVNGALVVLSSQLRGRTEVLREACAARADRPISSLVEAGRGGLPQDPEATLPALYIAGRDLNPQPGTDTVEPSGTALHTAARLTMRCS
jgi:filamentous hemagglutinin family protein